MIISTTRLTFLLSIIISTLIMHSHASLPIRLLTHNIRYATTSPFTGEKPWPDRRPLIINEFKYNTLHTPESFLCLQEVLSTQLSDIMSGLGSEWSYIGVGRDDGKTKGEYSPIIYRKGVWEVESWKTVWLNEDGSVGKKGWDAGSVRIVTVGHFRHKESGGRMLGCCTHFDNAGMVSRRESAKIVLRIVGEESGNGNGTTLPFFLAGDLNSEMSGEAYQILNGKSSPLRDARELAGWRYGDQYTYTGFGDEKDVIDFVFVGRNDGDWKVDGYSVLPNRFDDGVFNSDHRAVVVDAVLEI